MGLHNGRKLWVWQYYSYAEFNFHTDPHAAKLVIQELSNKVILSPLNFTHKVIATSELETYV